MRRVCAKRHRGASPVQARAGAAGGSAATTLFISVRHIFQSDAGAARERAAHDFNGDSMDETQADKTQRRELIAFRIGAQEFCVDIMSVREIRGFTPATALPRAPSFVRGVINLRGAVLPIVDLAARLGFPATDPTVRHVIMVVQVDRQVVGLLVDAVLDILTVADSDIQPTPDVASEMAKLFTRGVLAIDGRMISWIALEHVLPAQTSEAA
jgi:purine-binding chemotaxis protein CheW